MIRLELADLTILVADDELENARAYARALRGYKVVIAGHGDEALTLLAEHNIDIVVADQRMPGASGALLLQRARAKNPSVRRIMVSASAQPAELLAAINYGEVERYLLKPVESERLRAVVDELAREYLHVLAQRQHVMELEDQIEGLRRHGPGPNQGELLERAELEFVRARRYRRPLCLLVFEDAPVFELDKVRRCLRELDIALRVGDRLVLVLPESDRRGALGVWHRLRELLPGVEPVIRAYPEDGSSLQRMLLISRAV